METLVHAPFSAEQVASLNTYQESGVFHQFTCGTEHRNLLQATENGWVCECGYTQDWAHKWMADWSWQQTRNLFP